jgi:hypothetical protein
MAFSRVLIFRKNMRGNADWRDDSTCSRREAALELTIVGSCTYVADAEASERQLWGLRRHPGVFILNTRRFSRYYK